jgi:hypothetical protein
MNTTDPKPEEPAPLSDIERLNAEDELKLAQTRKKNAQDEIKRQQEIVDEQETEILKLSKLLAKVPQTDFVLT